MDAWMEAHVRIVRQVESHPDFARLVREVAVAEQGGMARAAWLRRNSRTYGSWITRGEEPRRVGTMSRRAWLLAAAVAADLDPPWEGAAEREAAAAAYVAARDQVRERLRGHHTVMSDRLDALHVVVSSDPTTDTSRPRYGARFDLGLRVPAVADE